jgi:hypothetical protein
MGLRGFIMEEMAAAQNLSTFRATPEEARKLDECLQRLGIGTRSNFFRCVAHQFVKQAEAGELPWPPEFIDHSNGRLKRSLTKKKRG